jgi:hypothetical protein
MNIATLNMNKMNTNIVITIVASDEDTPTMSQYYHNLSRCKHSEPNLFEFIVITLQMAHVSNNIQSSILTNLPAIVTVVYMYIY